MDKQKQIDNQNRWLKAVRFNDLTLDPSNIAYEYDLAPSGAYFRLLVTPDKSKEEIESAKRWLKAEKDVIRISVERLDPFY